MGADRIATRAISRGTVTFPVTAARDRGSGHSTGARGGAEVLPVKHNDGAAAAWLRMDIHVRHVHPFPLRGELELCHRIGILEALELRPVASFRPRKSLIAYLDFLPGYLPHKSYAKHPCQ